MRATTRAREHTDDGTARAAALDRAIAAIRDVEPERDYQVGRCVEAWDDLSTTRGIGMALGPIPWDKMVLWCEVNGLDQEASALMIAVLRRLDCERSEREASKAALENTRGKR